MGEIRICKKCSERNIETDKTYKDTWICEKCNKKLNRFYLNHGFTKEDIDEINEKDDWALEIMFTEIDNGYSFQEVLEEYGYEGYGH